MNSKILFSVSIVGLVLSTCPVFAWLPGKQKADNQKADNQKIEKQKIEKQKIEKQKADNQRTDKSGQGATLPAILNQAPLTRVRTQCPVRLGGIFLRGLGESADPAEDSAANGTKLSEANRDWIAANCDVAAFSPNTLLPDTLRKITATQPAFTPLLYTYASTLYEQAEHRGNVGGWEPKMADWTLRDEAGKEVPHPDKGGHWMDFANTDWAAHWQKQMKRLVGQYGAQGSVVAELPLGNTFVPDKLQKYSTVADRLKATTDWLSAARAPGKFLMVPSSIGFDALAGYATAPLPQEAEEPELSGRVWDALFPLVNGAWMEDWTVPYLSGEPVPDAIWDRNIQAADRADRADQVMIVNAAYHNEDELEYVLASFLLAYHRQGRCVLQPMPLVAGQPPDAGFSFAVFRKEITTKFDYFNVPLGVPLQERHLLPVVGGNVWKRQFVGGDVYVNSDDRRTMTLRFGGDLQRVNHTIVREIEMPPHSGVILLHVKPQPKKSVVALPR